MNKYICYLLSIFVLAMAFSASAKNFKKTKELKTSSDVKTRIPAETEDSLHVLPMSENFPTEAFKNNPYRVHKPNDQETTEILTSDVREKFLVKSGAIKYVEGWDELEKDILFLRIKKYDLQTLTKAYPMIPQSVFEQLKQILN